MFGVLDVWVDAQEPDARMKRAQSSYYPNAVFKQTNVGA